MKYNNFKQYFFTLALTAVFALGSLVIGINSYAAEAVGTASATVVAPISIADSSPDLRFGSFSTTDTGQTVTVATDGQRSASEGLSLETDQDASGAASFIVTGEETLTYVITLPETVNITTGAASETEIMAVNSFVSNPSGTGVLTGGTQTLLVGATITTVASQVIGDYTGNFIIIVEYN